MTRETDPDAFIEEFASTFREWHYLIGGGAVGFVLGYLVALYAVLRVVRRRRRRP